MGDERERMAQDIESYRRERKQLQESNARFFDEIAALRGALQALVNSTEATYYGISEYKAARAAAVALLAGPGGET